MTHHRRPDPRGTPRPGTLAERARRTEDVIERHRTKPFSWMGANCIRLARAQAVALGHKLPPVPPFRSALSARRALATRGAKSVGELLDKYFPRLPAPAFAIAGDLVTLPGEDGELEAVMIADGLGNLYGWHGAGNDRIVTVKLAMGGAIAAWRL
ncbi:DUF6950 family protein [Alteraurantiacibacter palmitatis]|uniref:DUF6950 family protein n=1 Tax=Alteraurantiacibacter palmitatis TaxID=2054628 RepID=A0ABV7E4B9_9SPHN